MRREKHDQRVYEAVHKQSDSHQLNEEGCDKMNSHQVANNTHNKWPPTHEEKENYRQKHLLHSNFSLHRSSHLYVP